jgi:carboxyl-terminal processing protease
MNRKSLQAILIPICALLIFALGILIGRNRAIDTAGIEADDKLSRALQLIKEQYVDTVNEDRLMDMALTALFKSLDPHSEYIPASDLQSVNEDLEGSFSGVGISFQIVADTVTVIDAIVGGPAEKLGIMAGDRIISADGEPLAGPAVTNEDVFRLLRGKKGTVVDLEIKRQNSPNSTHFSVTRADIPVNTVDAAYLLEDRMTGYIKLSKFTPSSYTEFMDAMLRLQAEGAKSLILDLRDNPGGYMDQAILIVNQFLPANRKIVFTKARTADNRMSAISDGTGILTRMPVAVLINEYSASASEIIAGAIQDNDRGPVVGRRSYGKGLVQTQATLPDNSAIRLTVARYYTPSGRSIQKEYKIGDVISYEMDIMNRYKRGEFFYMDSIQLDRTRPFRTKGGRTVYGGGGIMPDYFVPEDTTYITSYYIGVNNAGLIQQYSFMLADRYRSLARGMKSASQVLRLLPSDDLLLEGFADYAESKGMPAQWYYIDISAPVMLGQIKAFVVRDLLGYDQFYKVFNLTDRTIEVALDVLKKGKLPASPISR